MNSKTQEAPSILIVDDDLELAEMLHAYFRAQGYQVSSVNFGEDAVKYCASKIPDLMILDINMPDIDGFEVAKRLRAKRSTQDLPIIFLTGNEQREFRMEGLELGADDYMTKPFDVQELRLRVRNSLTRASQTQLRNRVTNLPEGQWVDECLRETLADGGDWAVLMISLKNMSHFKEEYGFITADDVLRAISLMIENTVEHVGCAGNFLGHFGADQFLVVTDPDTAEELKGRLVAPLKQSLDFFYPMRDRESDNGRLKSIFVNRLSVRFGILLNTQGPFSDINALKGRLNNLTLL